MNATAQNKLVSGCDDKLYVKKNLVLNESCFPLSNISFLLEGSYCVSTHFGGLLAT